MPFKPGQSGNPNGRPRGQTDKRRTLRQLIEAEAPALVQTAIDLAKDGDVAALRLLLERSLQPYKATLPMVMLPALRQAKTLTCKAHAVLDATADGKLSPDIGVSMLASLAHVSKVIEIDELVRRVEALEKPK